MSKPRNAQGNGQANGRPLGALGALAVALAIASAVTAASAQQVYRWTDANGRVQYSDQPPPADAKNVQQKNVGGNSIQNNELPLAAADAQKRNPVTLFVSECGVACDSAKQLLNQRGIPHTVVDPTRSLELNNRFKSEAGGVSIIPVLKVGSKIVTGFNDVAWASALDAAGYPKTPAFAKPKPVEDKSGVDAAGKSSLLPTAPATPAAGKAAPPPRAGSAGQQRPAAPGSGPVE
ncbi:MAG: glutaredoxin family protein [Burkholderiales bacterium]|nr:glutaredoxin family protein [Burkholderiales bacterium]